jgi:hypothetical protein
MLTYKEVVNSIKEIVADVGGDLETGVDSHPKCPPDVSITVCDSDGNFIGFGDIVQIGATRMLGCGCPSGLKFEIRLCKD